MNIDWLKANSTMIHYFGLGFIQVKLGDLDRVHFYLPGYCDECGLVDCYDPGCQQIREALTHPDETLCNCVAIREALGASARRNLIGGHEPDCVCTNDIQRWEGWA